MQRVILVNAHILQRVELHNQPAVVGHLAAEYVLADLHRANLRNLCGQLFQLADDVV